MSEPGTSTSPVPSGEAALRELALRLVAPRVMGSVAASEIQLLPGQLPPDLPFALPLPDGSRIVGSQAGGGHDTIVLDVPLPATEAIAFYRERMKPDGWDMPDVPHMRQGGFMHTGSMNMESVTLFQGKHGPMLNIVAYRAAAGAPTDLRLTLTSAAERRQFGPMHQPHRDMMDMIPPLTAPTVSQQWSMGGGGGGNTWHSNGRLETDLDLAAVAVHYTGQIEQGGWQRKDGGISGPVAWSTWTLRDKDGESWRGLFFVLQPPDRPREYTLQVRLDWDGGGQNTGGGGWHVVTS